MILLHRRGLQSDTSRQTICAVSCLSTDELPEANLVSPDCSPPNCSSNLPPTKAPLRSSPATPQPATRMGRPPTKQDALSTKCQQLFRLHQSGLQCTLSNSCTHQLSGIARCILYFNVLCPTISSAFAHHNTDVQMTSDGKKNRVRFQ